MAKSPYSGQRFRKAIRYFVVGRAAQAVATIVVTLLAVRLLDPTAFGIYMVLWGLVELGVPLTSLGLLPAVQRFLPELAERGTPERLRRFVGTMMLARIGLIVAGALAVGGCWPALSQWMGSTDTRASVAWLGACMLGFVLVSRFSAEMLECLLEQRFAQTARALLPFLRALGFVALWATGQATLVNMLWVDVSASFVAMAVGEVWLARSLRAQQPDGDFDVSRREVLEFVWHMSGAQLLNAASSAGTLRLVVARLLGVEVAGQFSFLQQLIAIGNRYLPSVLLANMLRPMLIARHAGGQAVDVAHGFGLLWKINIGLVWPGVPLMLLAGDPLIRLASGGRVKEAGLAMALLMVGLAARGQHQIVGMAMQVYRYTALARIESLVGLTAPLMVFLLAGFGLAGVSLGVGLALLLRGAVALTLLQRQDHRVHIDWNGGVRLAAALLMATAVGYAVGRELQSHWLAAAGMLLAYPVMVRLLKPMSAPEFSLVARAVGARSRWLAGFARSAA